MNHTTQDKGPGFVMAKASEFKSFTCFTAVQISRKLVYSDSLMNQCIHKSGTGKIA